MQPTFLYSFSAPYLIPFYCTSCPLKRITKKQKPSIFPISAFQLFFIIFHKLFRRFPHLLHHRFRSDHFYFFSKAKYPPEELRTDVYIHTEYAVFLICWMKDNVFAKAVDKYAAHAVRKPDLYLFFISLIHSECSLCISCQISIGLCSFYRRGKYGTK